MRMMPSMGLGPHSKKNVCENEMVMCVRTYVLHRIRKKKVFSTYVLLSKLNLHL